MNVIRCIFFQREKDRTIMLLSSWLHHTEICCFPSGKNRLVSQMTNLGQKRLTKIRFRSFLFGCSQS